MTEISQSPRRIALIGFGALGKSIASMVQSGHLPGVEVAGALVVGTPPQNGPLKYWLSLDDLLESRPDLVVEVAGHTALQSHGSRCLREGCDVVAASVGALMDPFLHAQLMESAQHGRSRLLVPSGALGGLDYLRAARRVGPVQVKYRGCKPVAAWRGTAAESLVDLDAVKNATTFFRGNAQEAATRFPQNANVVAALAIAVGSAGAVSVELVADPSSTHNRHEVTAAGDAGTIHLSVENSPSPDNPKSSRVTAFSILDTVAAYWGDL